MREEKNNRKYAGQVVDIPRSNYRLSVIDRLKKMTEEEGDPFLNIFSNRSIYLISLFCYEKKQSLVANLPLRDMPLLKKRTDCAEEAIFRAVNFQSETASQIKGDGATGSIPPAKHQKASGFILWIVWIRTGKRRKRCGMRNLIVIFLVLCYYLTNKRKIQKFIFI